jgi:hypothetical protein
VPRAAPGFEGTGACERRGDPDVRLEIFFTINLCRPARLEQSCLRPQRIDHTQRFPEAELLAIAPVLVLVFGEQIPSLVKKGCGRM